ncbi:hypothetical protein CHLNCDRAFT_140371 [Chlorella variabilis]|uniref:Putative gamma-glutamylcyclotransferase n=1 Tax=Chlorella variabilis TaxID=554065 RepID=E1Z6W3_CHLVA|nr:hypothetical protein CHLNCDRAFT_140371 [Chlorella variabilis]EFN58718.1 hypothetical protein CHLNCDRAFT_140371 [Chlorella variabilis]|eukprot:XP_005850820.1 hypothetical protein CHLNCDRAFT_140371 [Chlorella variabilis]
MSAFVYGTLMYPEVLNALINRVPKMEPAVILGYQRYRIRGQVFPGTIRSAPDSQVAGMVLLDLQPDELEMFDEFEGDEYYKEGVEARLEGGAACPTTVYIWQDSLRSYLYGEWDPQEFRERELERYVEMCAGFAADVQQQRRWKGEFQPSSSSEEEQQQQQQREAPGGGPPGGEA